MADCAHCLQIHLSIAGPSAYWVMWVTGKAKVLPAVHCSSTLITCTPHQYHGLQSCHVVTYAQTGQMRLTPNNPNSVASVVEYGFSADNLNFTATGYAEAWHAFPNWLAGPATAAIAYCCLGLREQVYDQIYTNYDPNKAGVGSAPNATNYTSGIIHNCQIPNLKGNTQCASCTVFSSGDCCNAHDRAMSEIPTRNYSS